MHVIFISVFYNINDLYIFISPPDWMCVFYKCKLKDGGNTMALFISHFHFHMFKRTKTTGIICLKKGRHVKIYLGEKNDLTVFR